MIGHLTKQTRQRQREDSLLAFESFLLEQQARVLQRFNEVVEAAAVRTMLDEPHSRRDLIVEVRK